MMPQALPSAVPAALTPVSLVPSSRHVFVYGTLRAGGSNDIRRYRPAPQRVGDAVAQGTLFDLGAYPGLRLDGASAVIGEVYRIDARVEQALDRLESVTRDDSGEYRKRSVVLDVRLGSSGRTERLDCLTYEIHPNRLAGRASIPSGDWIAHLARLGD